VTDHQRVMLVGLVVLVTLVKTGVTSPGVEVEDLTGKQFEAALETEDNLAVYWYGKNCKTCDRVLGILERVGQDVADNGITLVRVSDKKAAKTYNIRNFPALSLFRNGEPSHFEGELTSASAILDFLASPEALDLPGQIEDVTASALETLVEGQDYVAVFFCKSPPYFFSSTFFFFKPVPMPLLVCLKGQTDRSPPDVPLASFHWILICPFHSFPQKITP